MKTLMLIIISLFITDIAYAKCQKKVSLHELRMSVIGKLAAVDAKRWELDSNNDLTLTLKKEKGKRGTIIRIDAWGGLSINSELIKLRSNYYIKRIRRIYSKVMGCKMTREERLMFKTDLLLWKAGKQ